MKSNSADKNNEAVSESTRATCQKGQFTFRDDHTCGIYRICRENCSKAANRIVPQIFMGPFFQSDDLNMRQPQKKLFATW